MEHVYVSKHKVAAAAADYDAVCHTNDVFGWRTETNHCLIRYRV